MSHMIFWDVDTQYDFMMPDGKLYVGGAELRIPALERLTAFARDAGILRCGSVDHHAPTDPELDAENPDFEETFPPHCLAGTAGAAKISATVAENPLWIDSEPLEPEALRTKVNAHDGEIYLRKQQFDVFSNPNTDPLLDLLAPKEVVVYGVALDVCDAYAVEGLLRRGGTRVSLVADAVQAIVPERGAALIADWRNRGVRIVTTEEITAAIPA